MHSVVEYLEQATKRTPNKLAVADGKIKYTYSQLRARALSITEAIDETIFNSPIAVFLPKSSDALASFMGILYSGNFYSPLDEKTPLERLKNILSRLKPKAIITSKPLEARLRDALNELDWNIQVICIEQLPMESVRCPEALLARCQRIIDTDPIYVIHTSGSTGVPKGVVIPHRGVHDLVNWAVPCYSLDEDTIIGNQSSLYFDLSTFDIYLALKAGATLQLIPEFLFTFPLRLVDYLAQERINFITWVPTAMAQVQKADALAHKRSPYLKKILFIGEVMPTKCLNYWRKHYPDALFSNFYGPTEITVGCTYYIINREFKDEEPLPIGRPRNNCEVLILNGANLPAKSGEVGELCFRGSLLASGYWNNPEATMKNFVQNPLHSDFSDIIYRTGDLGFWNENGEIMCIGRRDDQIKHNGYRIELGEIEASVLRIKCMINACAVYDSDKKEIILFYEASDPSLNENFVNEQLADFVPKYMRPNRCVRMESMPRNPNGKIDRLALKKSISSV